MCRTSEEGQRSYKKASAPGGMYGGKQLTPGKPFKPVLGFSSRGQAQPLKTLEVEECCVEYSKKQHRKSGKCQIGITVQQKTEAVIFLST